MILLLAVVPVAALVCAGLIRLLMPLLRRYALARPNARSSHREPTPQGGGIAVVAAALAVLALVLASGFAPHARFTATVVAGAALALALLGACDDIRPLPAGLRLVVQFGAVASVLLALPTRVLPEALPAWLEWGLLAVAGVWWVNLVNFMDGLDWLSVAETVPVTACLAGLGLAGALPPLPTVAAAALLGAMLGFAPFNRPVARLFLGDVGSLPLGLLTGWMLLELAATGALAAAVILALYYLADATLTLLRRLGRGERVWEAHRTHFYQQATDNGFTPLQVSGHVLVLNLALAGLAVAAVMHPAIPVQAAALLAGAGLVALVLRRFSRPPGARAEAA